MDQSILTEGERLGLALRALRISQAVLAQNSGYSGAYIAMICNDRCRISPRAAPRLADGLRLSFLQKYTPAVHAA